MILALTYTSTKILPLTPTYVPHGHLAPQLGMFIESDHFDHIDSNPAHSEDSNSNPAHNTNPNSNPPGPTTGPTRPDLEFHVQPLSLDQFGGGRLGLGSSPLDR